MVTVTKNINDAYSYSTCITVVVKFSPPPEFDPSKKLILVKALPKGTCPRKSCEIQGGGLNLTTTVRIFVVLLEHFLYGFFRKNQSLQYRDFDGAVLRGRKKSCIN